MLKTWPQPLPVGQVVADGMKSGTPEAMVKPLFEMV